MAPTKGTKTTKVFNRKTVFKKRHFSGNRHSFEADDSYVTASAKKLKTSTDFDVTVDRGTFHVVILFSIFSMLAQKIKCKVCNGEISFGQSDIRGLGFQLNVICSCGCTKINSTDKVNNAYAINNRLVFVMRLLGVGHAGTSTFCSLMDLGSFSGTGYYNMIHKIKTAATSVAQAVLKKSGAEERKLTQENSIDGKDDELTVSGDGTWSKRGFSSLMGVSTLIGKYSGKILDYFVSSKFCKTCEFYKKTKNPAEFEIWYESEHKTECHANYEGSSGGMEVQGIIEMFRNSVNLHGAKYLYYIGDGDSKTFTNLSNDKPYGDEFKISKLECVLHVGKRMFRHLKDLKKTLTERKKLQKLDEKNQQQKKTQPKKKKSEPKTVGLTGKVMKKLSVYYSLAIQRNVDSVDNMKKAILASFYHSISTDAAPQHDHCDVAWCDYLKAQQEGLAHSHKPAIEEEIRPLLKNIYETLTEEKLLERCLGGNTQNNNECYNKTLWAMAPKHIFVGKETIDLSAAITLSIFNEGRLTLLKMMETLGIKIGTYAHDYAMAADKIRLKNAQIQTAAATKEARIQRKEDHNNDEIAYEVSEGLLYGPGIAN